MCVSCFCNCGRPCSCFFFPSRGCLSPGNGICLSVAGQCHTWADQPGLDLVGRKEHTVSLAWEISGREVGLGFWSFFSAAGNSKKQLDGDWSRTSVRHVGGGALCWARSENAGGSRLLQVVPHPSPLGESELWEAPQRRRWE